MRYRTTRRAVAARARQVDIIEAQARSRSYTPARRVGPREAAARVRQIRLDEPGLAAWQEWAGIGRNCL